VLLNMAKPKYFMPMHGEYRMLYKHVLLAQELGMSAENTFVMEFAGRDRRTQSMKLSVPTGICTVTFVFLPGSHFDFERFRFHRISASRSDD